MADREILTLSTLPAGEDVPLICPDPGCGGQVVEVDLAMRWNSLRVVQSSWGQPYLHTYTDNDFTFEQRESEPFICDKCLREITFEGEAADLIDNIEYD